VVTLARSTRPEVGGTVLLRWLDDLRVATVLRHRDGSHLDLHIPGCPDHALRSVGTGAYSGWRQVFVAAQDRPDRPWRRGGRWSVWRHSPQPRRVADGLRRGSALALQRQLHEYEATALNHQRRRASA